MILLALSPRGPTSVSAESTGLLVESKVIEADVYFDGQKTDNVAFGERRGPLDYQISIEAA